MAEELKNAKVLDGFLQVQAAPSADKVLDASPDASTKVEVDMEKAESLQVTRGDFLASLENDIKPCVAFYSSQSPRRRVNSLELQVRLQQGKSWGQ
ncbi:hypothetical protein P7K49_010696 [Saguinus oedipus]|uniref:Uncharacterized protein n=1 Tax=Saguinus oedipus TaxID=9490 RepID=A0ABQ9VP53_SAGOE|nr:hypothetical protein P7K49_010696 [Saguinus oedipus]